MITNEPFLFDKRNRDMKKIIKKQGNNVCRNKINKKALHNILYKFDYGYAILNEKANIGKKIIDANDKYKLISYVLFRINYIGDKQCIFIELICSDDKYKDKQYGTKMIELCKKYAVENNIKYIQLHSLNELKLLKWYEQNGFNIIVPIKLENETKAYLMDCHL